LTAAALGTERYLAVRDAQVCFLEKLDYDEASAVHPGSHHNFKLPLVDSSVATTEF
jgi:hypothetical protein